MHVPEDMQATVRNSKSSLLFSRTLSPSLFSAGAVDQREIAAISCVITNSQTCRHLGNIGGRM